jgi:hypothetical protein
MFNVNESINQPGCKVTQYAELLPERLEKTQTVTLQPAS